MTPDNGIPGAISCERRPLLARPAIFISDPPPEIYTVDNGKTMLEALVSANTDTGVVFIGQNENERCFYVRDSFQVFSDLVFAFGARNAKFAKKALEKISGKKVLVTLSELGVGGKVIRSGNLVLVPDELKDLSELELLKQRGYQVDFLPMPLKSEASTGLSRRMWFSRHLDMEINVASLNGYLFVVNLEYYRAYKKRVDDLVGRYNGGLVVVEGQQEQTAYRAVNFIELPNRMIVVPENCTEARGKIGSLIGQDNILAAKVDFSRRKGGVAIIGSEVLYFHGGLRCLSNVVI